MRYFLREEKGFTLIELLIVIVIVGVLATLLMTNFIGIRQRARDTQRKSDLRQIQASLEEYRADLQTYPSSGSTDYPNSCGDGSQINNNGTVYMAKIPCDPLTNTYYKYTNTGNNTYYLYACLENTNDSQKDASPQSGCTASYTVKNP